MMRPTERMTTIGAIAGAQYGGAPRRNDYVQKPDLRIISVLAGLAGRYGKTWIFPAQRTIVDMLYHRTEWITSRRTLNRHLGALVHQGWIERKRRHKRGANGKLELHSTIYVLRKRVWLYMRSIAPAIGMAAKLTGFLARFLAVPEVAQRKDHLYDHTHLNASSDDDRRQQ